MGRSLLLLRHPNRLDHHPLHFFSAHQRFQKKAELTVEKSSGASVSLSALTFKSFPCMSAIAKFRYGSMSGTIGDLGVRPDRGCWRADVAAGRRDAAAGARVAGTAPMTSPRLRQATAESRRDSCSSGGDRVAAAAPLAERGCDRFWVKS